jgi:hypothetical protein
LSIGGGATTPMIVDWQYELFATRCCTSTSNTRSDEAHRVSTGGLGRPRAWLKAAYEIVTREIEIECLPDDVRSSSSSTSRS